ncbi:hypothetical protein LCGC14_3018020, partial [marine sediment metagenome]
MSKATNNTMAEQPSDERLKSLIRPLITRGPEGPPGTSGKSIRGLRGDKGSPGPPGKGVQGDQGKPGDKPTRAELAKLIQDILRDSVRTTPGLGHVVSAGTSTGGAIGKNNATTSAPGVTDDTQQGYKIGSRWFDTSADEEYVCLDSTAGAAVWTSTTLTSTEAIAAVEGEPTLVL